MLEFSDIVRENRVSRALQRFARTFHGDEWVAITIATDVNTSYLSAAWLDDGTIVYTGAAGDLRRVSSDGGSSRPVQTSTGLRRANLSAFSPVPVSTSSTPSSPTDTARLAPAPTIIEMLP